MVAWAERFPRLFEPTWVAYASADTLFVLERPPDELITRVHVLGRCDGGVVVSVAAPEERFLPGGKREVGETLEQTVDRELIEEAGARRTSPLLWLGAQRVDSRLERPYWPHWPHPRSYWAFVVTDVVVDGRPTNPDDGEQVSEVATLDAGEAADYLDSHDPLHGDVVRLGSALGLV